MEKDSKVAMQSTGASKGTLTYYVVGYLLSLELTMASYLLVTRHVNSHHVLFTHRFLVGAIATLAIMQLLVQLICFLHLNRESKPRWNLTVLAFAAIVVVILVFGSLWIMDNLNYHQSQEQINKYIQSQGDL
jgi:cytochrome o ubiquinol oxidase operon protein cyoD